MDQYSNLFTNPMMFYQQQNPNFFNPASTSNCNYQRNPQQYYNYNQNYQEESSSSQSQQINPSTSATYASQFADFASNPLDTKEAPKKKKKRSNKVSTTKWPETDATIIREQVTQESELVREQVLIPETADISKLVVYSLGPKCSNPFLCRKLKKCCSVFIEPLRQHILKTFKNDLNEGERRVFILNNIEAFPTKKKNVYKLQYFLKDHRFNKRLQVCKTMFLNTLCISSLELKNLLKKSQCGMIASTPYYPPKMDKKKPNQNLFFSHNDYGDNAMSDHSDHDVFDSFKEEPDFSDPEEYDPLNRNTIPKDLPGVRKKKNIEDMIKSGEISKITCPEEMGPRCASKRCKTCENFNEERRNLLFSSFWNMMNWRERKEFILKTVICRKPNKTIYANGKSPRQFTYDYMLPLSYNLKDYQDPNVQLVPVCSIMYINTLGIKINVVKRFIKQGPDNFDEIQVEKIIQDPKYLLEAQMRTKHKRRINWKEVHKELRNKGEAYFSMKRVNNELRLVARQPRKLKPRCPGSGCVKSNKRRCPDITDAQREELFENFWKNLDKEQKKLFICEHVLEHKVERRRALKGYKKLKKLNPDYEPNENSRRDATFRYYLPIGDEKYQVCQKMFLNTLAVTSNYVHCWRKCNFKLFKGSFPEIKVTEAKEEAQEQAEVKPKEENPIESEDSSSEDELDEKEICDDRESAFGSSDEEVIVPRTTSRRKRIKEEVD